MTTVFHENNIVHNRGHYNYVNHKYSVFSTSKDGYIVVQCSLLVFCPSYNSIKCLNILPLAIVFPQAVSLSSPLPSELSPPPAPPSPLTRTVAHSLAVTANRGWLCSQESSVSLDSLPHWIGQISLSGIETERVSPAEL